MFPKSVKLDINRRREVERHFRKVRPEVIVHAAAETDVDRCERDKHHATKVNAEGTKILAEACSRFGARIVYISTDYVFNGRAGFYSENDTPDPVNHYGVTKLKGEQSVTELVESFAILRTSVLYGFHESRQNFTKWIVEALIKRKHLSIVEDHFNSPTSAENLAEVMLEAIDVGLEGTYHAAGSERISRYRFAIEIARAFDLDSTLIKPIKMSELKSWTARRPRDSSLCIDKVKNELNTKLKGTRDGLREMIEKWKTKQ